ncbi:hypothetical protein HanXRQr2_Chr03g0138421 [Helianthus annuus]|uniref:Uncharacterized protein n=1 Tax=Helianthus annuus TaxID=4232 RepID=A0A9K3JKZ9_HELAN|nr:hypothetical protein HanXRQr2_Chr03g0138421 [Helianthus annuus]KAJ0946056.1 hypothetical protein HanPSC8_Chr03g0134981 [Helianthus annuus]
MTSKPATLMGTAASFQQAPQDVGLIQDYLLSNPYGYSLYSQNLQFQKKRVY